MLPLNSRIHRFFAFALIASVCGMLLAALAGQGAITTAHAAVSNGTSPISVLGTSTEPASDTIASNATTIPHWQASFTSGGITYPYAMVGSDPAAGSATTTIPVELIPLRFVFPSGDAYDASSTVASVVQSPIFQPAQFASGYTQYGDAMLRADFWGDVSTVSPDWHVLLSQPTIYPTQTIVVPSQQGSEFQLPTPSGLKTFSVVDELWLTARLNSLMNSLHISATTLPIFLSNDTFTTLGGLCCSIGFHSTQSYIPANGGQGNGVEPINTQIFAVWADLGFAGIAYGQQYANVGDITGLSHEVAEWLSDPFIVNTTPGWTAPIYGCQSILEVGDAVVSYEFPVTMSNGYTYHPQDTLFVPWFARSLAPTGTLGDQYDYLGAVTSLSPC